MSEVEPIQDVEEKLKARAAWHYYVEGLTQEKIPEVLGIGRVKVHRILAAARDEGVVQFKIKNRVIERVQLEGQLKQKFGLFEALVVPRAADVKNIPRVVGHAAGDYLGVRFSAGDIIAVVGDVP